MSDYLLCSFCGKGQNEVEYIIAGPAVYICNECVDLCVEIIEDRREEFKLALRYKYLPKFVDDWDLVLCQGGINLD